MANLGVAPPNFSTNVGLFRALIGDTDAINVASGSGEYSWFSDEDITAFLSLYSSVKAAAARALYTVAASQALILKKFSTDDLHVDGAAIAEALRKQAADLMAEATSEAENADLFALSYPGRDRTYVPEGFPVPLPIYGREGENGYGDDGNDGWYIDEDGYIVND